MLGDKGQYQLLFECCRVIVDVVEDCLETSESLGPEEAEFLLTTSVWVRALMVGTALETVMIRPDAATFIQDTCTVFSKTRPANTVYDVVCKAVTESDALSAIKPLVGNSTHFLETMPKISA